MVRKYMYLLLKIMSEGDGNKVYIIMNLLWFKMLVLKNYYMCLI